MWAKYTFMFLARSHQLAYYVKTSPRCHQITLIPKEMIKLSRMFTSTKKKKLNTLLSWACRTTAGNVSCNSDCTFEEPRPDEEVEVEEKSF